MIRLKNEKDLAGIRASCRLLASLHKELSFWVQEGMTTKQVDAYVHTFIMDHHAQPAFLGYMGFPASACISINEEVIHGIPGSRIITHGDIVSIDIGINYQGYYSDAAQTIMIGEVNPEVQKLVDVTRECLYLGIQEAVVGNRISHIGKAVSAHAEGAGFSVVREYCGHGVGFAPHEDPQVPNYPSRTSNQRLRNGMVLALEPMVNMGTHRIRHLDDQWTVVTADNRPSAHWEHTIAVHDNQAEILTAW